MSTDPPLVLDTDFVSSFAWVNRMDILETLYTGRMLMLEEVEYELSKVKVLKSRVEASIAGGHIVRISMSADSPEAAEFGRMHDSGRYGLGEAACMAYVTQHDGVVASNNLKDVKAFCTRNGKSLLTTAGVLLQAFDQGIITQSEADDIWRGMLAKRRLLPAASFSAYLANSGYR